MLSVRTATRIWETRRWQQQGGSALDDWEPLQEEVCTALVAGPKTREELSARLAQTPLAHLSGAAAGTGADSLYKPLHWWGDICFGPQREGQSTFRLLRGDPAWPGLRAVDDAGPELVTRYLGSYGPATATNLHYGFTEGLGVPRRRLHEWLTDPSNEVTIDGDGGQEAYVLNADLEALRAAAASPCVRLLSPFDPWILGPGTADTRLIAPGPAGPLLTGRQPLISGGAVVGMWRLRPRTVEVSCFQEAGAPSAKALEAEVQRLGEICSERAEPCLVQGVGIRVNRACVESHKPQAEADPCAGRMAGPSYGTHAVVDRCAGRT